MANKNFYSIEYYNDGQMVIRHGFMTDEEEAWLRINAEKFGIDMTIVKLVGGCDAEDGLFESMEATYRMLDRRNPEA